MSWYSIRAPKALANQPARAEVWIYGDIGESWSDETVTARQFVADLQAIAADEITVRINSVGGSVPDGLAIYNAIKRHPAAVTVSVDGVAMSIASLITMAGDTIEMADNGMLMIHAPWMIAAGNAQDLREQADTLDKWAAAMATSYAAKTGKPAAEILALLTDGQDHYYTAAEALASGWVDAVVAAMPIAASAAIPSAALSRYQPAAQAAPDADRAGNRINLRRFAQHAPQHSTAAAAAQPSPQETTMADNANPQAAATQQAAPQAADLQAEFKAKEKARREGVQAKFAPFARRYTLDDLQRQCMDDLDCTPDAAAERILVKLAEGAEPVAAHHVVTIEDEADKQRDAVVVALLARAGVADAKTRDAAKASPYRGAKLLDIARAALDRKGIKHGHMDQMQVVAAAFTQSADDFPVLLEAAMHKTLQQAYATAPDTWSRFCAVGSVSDFRAHNRYRVGSLGNLDALNELGEFTNKSIPDGEKASVQIGTRGNIINLSRQTVVNDDLGAFIGLAAMLGRAARRTIEAQVYALLAENAGLGPTMADSKTLFHADHGNLTTGAAIGVEAIEADRVAMASQMDISGNDFLDLRPAVLLVPMGLGGTARVINNAEYDPDTANKLQRPNMVRGLFRDVVDTPRLSGKRRYLFAEPGEAPVIEVDFLDGNQEPYLEQETSFTVDGTRYKARLDFGVSAIDYRGAVTNAGQ